MLIGSSSSPRHAGVLCILSFSEADRLGILVILVVDVSRAMPADFKTSLIPLEMNFKKNFTTNIKETQLTTILPKCVF